MILKLHGRKVLISKIQRQVIPDGFDDALYPSGNNRFAWSRKHEIADIKWEQIFARREDTVALLKNKFTFVEEERNSDLSIKKPGLRLVTDRRYLCCARALENVVRCRDHRSAYWHW